ncbi:hypothetical protein Pelo_16890 [Pelomyxa schiedti]|nr:hypothetical protein Pelo_16890 [Pelomyxa schiedti]
MSSTATPGTDCHYDHQRRANRDRVLVLSRVVWDMVVVPGWLDAGVPPQTNFFGKQQRHKFPEWCRGHVDVFSVAEAMFPLVALACRRVLAIPRTATGNDPGSTFKEARTAMLR